MCWTEGRIKLKDAIQAWTNGNIETIESTFHHLHELAEVGWQETNTTAFLCAELDRIKLPYQTFSDQTGVVAVWDGGVDGPTIGLRADIDALYQNVQGEWKANHSCGHDAHMTMVLFAVQGLLACGFRPKGRLKIIFQPAEETGRGAKSLIDKGIVQDVDCLLGIHLRPVQEIPFGQASAAIYHGSTTQIMGKVHGVQAHAARPNQGINVVDALAAIVTAVNAVKVDPTVSASAKVTKICAGDSVNIIPDLGEFAIDVRAQTNEVMDLLVSKITNAVLHAGSANGSKVILKPMTRLYAAVPNAFMEEVARRAIASVLGSDGVSSPPVTPGGEDFHFYTKERPEIASTMIGLGSGLQPGLHHPQMTFNLEALRHGIAILAQAVVLLFEGTD